jgi:hypothetical protein
VAVSHVIFERKMESQEDDNVGSNAFQRGVGITHVKTLPPPAIEVLGSADSADQSHQIQIIVSMSHELHNKLVRRMRSIIFFHVVTNLN